MNETPAGVSPAVAIIGAGSIGVAWAVVFARAGHQVALHDADARRAEAALGEIDDRLARLRTFGLIEADVAAPLCRASVAPDLTQAVDGVGYVQECVVESLPVEREIFAELDRLTQPRVVLASSTSMIPCSQFAAGLPGRERCLVVHPGNPPHRLQGAVLREAYCLVRDGIASPDDIDLVVACGLGRRWAVLGRFATAELNTRGGIESHARLLGPTYARMGAERGQHDPWTPELVTQVISALQRRLPRADWAEHVNRRDRALIHLERATILSEPDDVWAAGDLILKVKEPAEQEYPRTRKGQTLFTYPHLAADRRLTEELIARKVTAIAYETVELVDRSLPLLAPMSEIAGRLAAQVGANTLMRAHGGRGVLMGGAPGVYPAKVVIIGAGVAGLNAAAVALGMQADVVLIDRNVARLREIDAIYQGRCKTVASNAYEIERAVRDADLVIGAVLILGAKAPTLVSNEQVSRMARGSVLVHVSIDQGGCFENSHPTTHADPTYAVHGSVFYCVANMPGAVPNTSTYALTNVTLPYVRALADLGWRGALRADRALARGLNTCDGSVAYGPVAQAHGLAHQPLDEALA